MTGAVRVGFTGDVMLGRQVDHHQQFRPVNAVWGNMLERLQALDGLCINLECCLSTRGEQWTETYRPFHFRANPDWAIPALTNAGVDYAALANNHLMDYGPRALLDTLEQLSDAGIHHSGAGADEADARTPAVFSISDLTVAVLSFTDNTPEFAAESGTPGTAYLELDTDDEATRTVIRRALGRAREFDPDFVVASLHWGPNMVTKPPGQFRTLARWLVDEGVDFLHGHSAHVFQGVEMYRGVPIVYDTGDFVDDYAVDSDLRNDRSFLFEATIDTDDGRVTELRLAPTEIYDYSVHEASAEAANWSRSRMRSLSEPFGTAFERDSDDLVISP